MKTVKRSPEEIQKTAAKIQSLRLEKGWGVIDMAQHLGLSRAGVHSFESGTRCPGTQVLLLLNREFGVSIDWLLFDRGPRTCSQKGEWERLQTRVAELEEKYEGAGSERRTEILETQQKELEMLRPVAELLNHYQETEGAFPPADQLKPEIFSLVRAMHESPRIYYEILLHYQKVLEER